MVDGETPRVLLCLSVFLYDPSVFTDLVTGPKNPLMKSRISFNQLKDITVSTLDNQPTTLGKVCEGRKGVVLSMLRRFGCVLCRDGAEKLSTIKPELDKLGVALVGVAPEHLGQDEFVKEEFFKGQLFVDEPRALYGALQTSRASIFSLLKPSVWFAASEARGRGKTGNLEGDGLQLGGTFAFDCNSGEALFMHYQENFGDHPDPHDVLKVTKNHFSEESQ